MLLGCAETDWLSTKTIFYNSKTKKISNVMLEVVDWDNFEFDAEGLINYLKYGYSVYGKTMVRDVFFLGSNQKITNYNGNLEILTEDTNYDIEETKERDVIELFEKSVYNYIHDKTNIILPLSGGYDSRWLAYICKGNDEVKTFTYGLSRNQSESYECVRARQIAVNCNLDNDRIELSDYHKYCNEWYEMFGPSVHLHGMYQIEFYKKILELNSNLTKFCISGIYGDALSGNVRARQNIDSPDKLNMLGLSHGMCIPYDVCKLKCRSKESEENFFENNRRNLKSENGRILITIQLKMILLSYLIKVPESMGISTYAPFLNQNIALSIMGLPWQLKENRRWQKDYFESRGLMIDENQKYDPYNSLNLMAFRKRQLQPLDSSLLGEVIDENFVEWVNHKLYKKTIVPSPVYKGTIKSQFNKLIAKYNSDFFLAYNYYLVLSPIERLIKERNKH